MKTEIIKSEDYQGFVKYELYVNDTLWKWATVQKLYKDSEYYHAVDPDTNNIISLRESEVVEHLEKMANWEPANYGLVPFWSKTEEEKQDIINWLRGARKKKIKKKNK